MHPALLTLMVLAGASAYSQKDRTCEHICLTSFRWCDDGGCDYPPDTYPLKSNLNAQPGYAMLLLSKTYEISWKAAIGERPVHITWNCGSPGATESGYFRWSTTVEPSSQTNSYQFSPGEIIASPDFQSQVPNITLLEATAMVAGIGNSITIHQGPLTSPTSGPYDGSQQFSVQNGWAVQFVTAAGEIGRQEEFNKWRMGVGIGVGLGVPILLVLTWLLARSTTKRSMRKQQPSK